MSCATAIQRSPHGFSIERRRLKPLDIEALKRAKRRQDIGEELLGAPGAFSRSRRKTRQERPAVTSTVGALSCAGEGRNRAE